MCFMCMCVQYLLTMNTDGFNSYQCICLIFSMIEWVLQCVRFMCMSVQCVSPDGGVMYLCGCYVMYRNVYICHM